MTFREKLAQEHLEEVNEEYFGGCYGCPENYGYEKKFDCATAGVNCTECWDREISKEQTTEEPKGENKMKNINAIVKDALLNHIGDSDIEDAVFNILEEIDIADLLAESDTLRAAVYTAVNESISSVIEMYL